MYLTPNERAAYAETLRLAIEVDKPEVEERLLRLQAMGEAMDEDEYNNARDDQAGIGGTIRYLPKLLARAELIPTDEARRAAYVRLGSRVVVRTSDGLEVEYQITGPFEPDLNRGQPVSFGGGIGRALMGRYPGDVVTVETPAGIYSLQIVSVEQSPML